MKELRRSFAFWIFGGGFIGSLISFLYPLVRFLNPPAVAEASVNEVADGKVEELLPNSGKIVKFGTQPVLLVRLTQTDWRAFSAVCTHLGCIVQYDPARRLIWCACHNGQYDLNGKVIAGPPPAPLQPYVVHVRGDELVISRT
ncbi:MAG TPA: Rieske (2Fe-2S) protein [Bryobacteraceae bacterium]|nr:Rieske (2Fe-2S) protein [Bryobacteraceae bacterium]